MELVFLKDSEEKLEGDLIKKGEEMVTTARTIINVEDWKLEKQLVNGN